MPDMRVTLGSIVSYVVGIPIALFSLVLLVLSPIALIPLALSLFIIPPIRRRITGYAGLEFSRGAVAGIGVVAVIAILGVAIAVSGGGSSQPGSDVEDISVSAVDASPDAPTTSLEVVWNSRAQSSVDPDPDDLSSYSSNEGQKFVVLRAEITNMGEESLELTPQMFRLRSSNVEYEYQALFGSGNSFSGVELNPEGSHSAWIAFSVPEGTTTAELFVDQSAFFDQTVEVQFDHDPEMAINMSD
jgi:hypothetical protein